MSEPKILFFDLETAPNTAYIWSLWNEVKSMDYVTSHWYVLCWAAKWLGSKEILSAGIYGKKDNDRRIIKQLWELLDEADIVVAHNAVKFDCRRINTRFIAHGMKPPSPYRVVDTLKEARRHFFFTSNRLNDLGEFFDVGKKLKTGGFQLWKDCMAGDEKAWNSMVRYCEQDVRLLEKVYLKLRPFMKTHPNLCVYGERPACPKCSSRDIQYRGFAVTNSSKYRQFQCKACGGWGRDKDNLLRKKISSSI